MTDQNDRPQLIRLIERMSDADLKALCEANERGDRARTRMVHELTTAEIERRAQAMTPQKKLKFHYLLVLQGQYGHGWEDLCQGDSTDHKERADLRADLRAYRVNAPEFSYRIINRREATA